MHDKPVVGLRCLVGAHDADAPAPAGRAERHRLTVDFEVPRRGDHPGERVEERRLPAPVRPDEAEDLVVAHVEAHAVDRADATEGDADVGRLEDGGPGDGRAARRGPGARLAGRPWQRRVGVVGGHRHLDERRFGDAEEVAQPRPLLALHRAMLRRVLDPVEDPDETLGCEDHHEEQHRAVDDLVVLADRVAEQIDVELIEDVRHPDVERGAEDRAPQRPDPADDEHHEDPETELDAELGRLGEPATVHEQRAGERADRRPEHEHHDAHPQRGNAEGGGDRRLVAHRDRLTLGRRAREPDADQEDGRQRHEVHPEEVALVGRCVSSSEVTFQPKSSMR